MSEKIKTTKDDFKFVGQDRKVYDQQIEGKPIGYFKDAFIRFRRNKMNVTAAVILILIIMMSIFVPILTTKNYTEIEEQLTYLAPRVPILEKFGIFDGTKKVKKEVVDLSTIDPVTRLGLPKGYNIEYVDQKSLKNFNAPSNDSGESSLGGEVIFSLSNNSKNYRTARPKDPILLNDDGVQFTIDVKDVSNLDNGTVELLIRYRNRYLKIGEFNQKGVHVFDLDNINGSVDSTIYVEIKSDNPKASITLNSIKGTYKGAELFEDKAYDLYSYKLDDRENSNPGVGINSRVNNYSIYASFNYNHYAALFSSRVITIGGNEYDEIRANNPTNDPVPNPENPDELIFEEGYVIKRIISKDETVINGITYATYQIEVDYAKYMGHNGIPYFLFGTDASGKDLFALTWVGLRTSLIIGVIVSFINITFGVVYGAISGYYGGKVDLVMERITEIIGRIPWLVTLSIFTALIGPGFLTLILILIISGWIGVASVTRTQFYRYKNREYVLASRTLGAKDGRLIFRHILPNGIGTIITSSILMIPSVIFSESSISYLGFGIGHGQEMNIFGLKLSGASLGVLLADGQAAIIDYPHLTVYPALIISILMITFNMFGNGLRDAFNPSLRGTE